MTSFQLPLQLFSKALSFSIPHWYPIYIPSLVKGRYICPVSWVSWLADSCLLLRLPVYDCLFLYIWLLLFQPAFSPKQLSQKLLCLCSTHLLMMYIKRRAWLPIFGPVDMTWEKSKPQTWTQWSGTSHVSFGSCVTSPYASTPILLQQEKANWAPVCWRLT